MLRDGGKGPRVKDSGIADGSSFRVSVKNMQRCGCDFKDENRV